MENSAKRIRDSAVKFGLPTRAASEIKNLIDLPPKINPNISTKYTTYTELHCYLRYEDEAELKTSKDLWKNLLHLLNFES
ncbi:Hypothetical predicted protein [Cloeon dipterum]|uniref:Uncharacterized protein n=1 Tax=Cloeon dipterum TaxID=197152 RepID=A0A8S1BYG4_9INSE|nr:Hypothetical predicted protein [Cloeon dipterum]